MGGNPHKEKPRRLPWLAASAVAICAAWGGLAAPAMATPAPAADTVRTDPSFPPELNARIEARDYKGALTLLGTLPDLLQTEKGFLLRIHLLEMTYQDDKAAILLEHRLSKDPNDGLARFEIAELHFRHRREKQATLDYRLALAGGLDGDRAGAAYKRLEGIIQRKSWHVWAAGSLTGNNGSTNDTTDITRLAIFGLPFSETAPGSGKTGPAFSGYVGAGRLTLLRPGVGIRTNILVTGTHDPGHLYDSHSISVQTGPEWQVGRFSHVSVTGRAIAQWLGNDLAQTGGGFALHGDTYGHDQLWAADISEDRLNVRYKNIGVGWNTRAEVKRIRYLDASTLWIFDAVAQRRGATFETLTFQEQQIKAGRLFQGPFSTFVYLEAAGRARQYDRNPLFSGLHRSDTYGQLTARFSKRDVLIFGAVPYVSVQASRNQSDITAYSNSRTRVDFGLTSDF
ncbi:hypothetical protein [Asticcacaulis solisilvae]|uniref:hypothetical protein n=1 Tax=Asticcacaulis solisilvae TaxID=1217274 RepID=UPI003FD6CCB7